LTNLASDNSKIFILDPEREYDVLAHNLNGKVIDVGSAKEGRINPLQVVTALDDEDENGINTSLSSHLQFLESFFKMILDGITMDALEILNECIKELYEKFGITNTTDIAKLRPEQFPIMQDLYNYVSEQHEKATEEYQKNNLRIIKVYLNKFAEGGRNSMLWNGYSSITSEENFIVFNFQTLLANANNDIANAQMMLIMRWLNNEIISNKDYNAKYHTKRRIIVVIDEAHVFIDPKKDVALDFMYNLAKRIRKYEGMQIVITQNLKDFTGTPDIARKSTAIINASQYSLIFSLAPHDINDLVQLYEKAGQINEKEQDTIVANPRGKAFLMTGPYSRTNIDILVDKRVQAMFEQERKPKPKAQN
jgi:type IV secretory pathway VirB4 component